MTVCPLGVSTGDPAGVGPEVSVRAASALCANDAAVLYGDVEQLRALAITCGVDRARLVDVIPGAPLRLPIGAIGLVNAGAIAPEIVTAHAPSAAGGAAQLRALSLATDAAFARHVRGLVTAPVSKEAIVAAGVPFTGHTEYLAQRAGLADDDVTMLFLGPRLSVALVTTHLSVKDAADAITRERVIRSASHLISALRATKGREDLRLVVTGLNPHAGESGLFGDEEVNVIAPALDALRATDAFARGGASLIGPRPAEAAFREASAGVWDGVVAMIHDQATIASKLLDWGSAVNVTWGLPFVRTSVDHGVAYDAARAGRVEPEGMLAAFALAQHLTRDRGA